MENPHFVIKVAIVEDNQFMRMAFEEIISKSVGFEITGVFNCAEDAVREIPLNQPDIVLMDINLGGMNGIEAISLLKVKCPAEKFMV